MRVDGAIQLAFDRPMDPASLDRAVSLSPTSGELATTISTDGREATILPGRPLAPSTDYVLSVSREARDTGGARLRREYTLRFRTAAGRQASCDAPAWSPDGSRILWLEDADGDLSLWVATVSLPERAQANAPGAAAGAGAVAQVGQPAKLAAGLWQGSRATWSPDGTQLLVVMAQSQGTSVVPCLAYVPATGGMPQPLALNGSLQDPSRLTAVFSPDGSLMAVQNDMYMADAHSDYLRQLGVARSDGSGWTEFGNLLVGWGTDDSWLIYLDMPGIGDAHDFDYEVWRYEPASGQKRTVPEAQQVNNFGVPARAPDGGYFIFGDWQAEDVQGPQGASIEHLPRDLWRMSADGGSAVRLTESAGHNGDPTVALDGKVAFASDRGQASDGWDIWVLPAAAAGVQATNLTASPGYDGQPAFSPDGRWIAFISDSSGTREVWLMSSDGSGRRLVSAR
jgi:Tol biopolymer transport system component